MAQEVAEKVEAKAEEAVVPITEAEVEVEKAAIVFDRPMVQYHDELLGLFILKDLPYAIFTHLLKFEA